MDFFNRTEGIYDCHIRSISRRNSLRFCYDVIDCINIDNLNGQCYIWENDKLIINESTTETFDKITFSLKNGNKICICPESSEMDGYLDVWAERFDFIQTMY